MTDTIEEDTISNNYIDYANTTTGRYCSLIQWLHEKYKNAKLFLISFPHNYLPYSWYVNNNEVLRKIGVKYNVPVVDMTVNVPFTKYNAELFRPK